MATDNRTLLEKADLALADLSGAGVLQPAQADRFFRIAIKSSVILPMVNVTSMNNPQEERPKIRFSGRVLRAGTEAQALSLADRSTPDLSLTQLSVSLFKAETRMSNEVLEDQIERGTFQNTVMEELGKSVGRDVEHVAINGDTASADTLLAVMDGWLKLATSNTVNASSARLNKNVLRDTWATLPEEFADMNHMYWTNRRARIDYRSSLQDRATGLGDITLTTSGKTVFEDMTVMAVPEFPNDLTPGPNDHTNVLMSDPQNLLVGFLRKVRVETDKDVSAGQIIIVATLRFDVTFMEETAVVKATAVKGQ